MRENTTDNLMRTLLNIDNISELTSYLNGNKVKLATTSFVARYKNGCFATSRGTQASLHLVASTHDLKVMGFLAFL